MKENDGHKDKQIQRKADHRVSKASRSRDADQGAMPQRRVQRRPFYKWRAKFGGMEVSDARRLKELEGENGKLKKLLAEAHLDTHALKSVFAVKR